MNSYPTQTSPNSAVKFNLSVSGTPSDMTNPTALYNTGSQRILRSGHLPRRRRHVPAVHDSVQPQPQSLRGGGLLVTRQLSWTYAGAALTLTSGATEVSWAARESPYVFKRDGWYYLSFTDTNSGSASYEDTILLR